MRLFEIADLHEPREALSYLRNSLRYLQGRNVEQREVDDIRATLEKYKPELTWFSL